MLDHLPLESMISHLKGYSPLLSVHPGLYISAFWSTIELTPLDTALLLIPKSEQNTLFIEHTLFLLFHTN